MDEGAARFWTVLFGGLTAISLVAGGIYTIVQYFDAKQKDRDVRETDRATLQLQIDAMTLSARQAFNTRHIELCSRASEDAGVLATSTDPSRLLKAKEDFWSLYWGTLGIVENREVEAAMVGLGNCLTALDQKDKTCAPELRSLSLNLAHACRAEVEKNFQVDLPSLNSGTSAKPAEGQAR
jgi:hypothetical protein